METTNVSETAVRPETRTRSWLWQPYLIVFISNTCIMVLELVAGRLVAPYVGVSLYTWTSIIGVVLAGISLGNYIGGRLADRWASLRLLGIAFTLSGLASLVILLVDRIGTRAPGDWPVVLQILVLTTVLFFLPSTVLGTISPIVAKLAVRDLARTGSTVGKIYAAGTVGSIVGTFVTGFVLISAFGTHAIVWGVSIVLLMMGLLFLTYGRAVILLPALALLAAGSGFAFNQGWVHGPCQRETNYYCIKVNSETRDGKDVQVLVLDRLVHSYTDLQDPKRLIYAYEHVYAEATAYRGKQDGKLNALFIGGGGYTFPKYMEALYPDSELDVIEIDPGVTQVVYDRLGLARDTRIVTYNEDARMVLKRSPAKRYNLIMGDAFNDFSVPYHLTTREFNDRVREWLTPEGYYMVNLIDGPQREFLRSYTRTMQETFDHVYIIPAIEFWKSAQRMTYVVIGSMEPIDPDAVPALDPARSQSLLAQMVLRDEQMAEVMAEGPTALLTDQYAPVDQMLTPVFRDEVVR